MERMMTATSGRRLSELYVKPGPLGSLARMLLESSRWFSPARRLKWEAVPLYSEKITEKEYCFDRNTSSRPSAVTLNEKVTKSSRLLFRLVPSERPTGGTGCGLLQEELLPTPTSIDSGSGRINKSPSPGAKERPTIALAAKMGLLPTPNAVEGEKYTKKYNPNSQMGKSFTAMAMNDMLPTPTTSCFRAGTPKDMKNGKTRDSFLNHAVAKQYGTISQLNPLFVQEMMGFPYLWTELPFQSGDRNP